MNQYKYQEIYIGMQEEFTVQVNSEKLRSFMQITGDENPLHNSADYAKKKGYPEKVVFGMLTGAFMSTLAGV